MKFAQFQSTYKPLPLDVYERTGQELEEKYYRNREQSSLLRQALSNTKVEDRNIGALAKATTDVENILSQVDGKWHYANNLLYNAKDRLITDKVLNASIEDFAKSQTAKQNEQKRFEEGKIDQAALSAFYRNEKRYNTKGIELDENGQTINRWSTPTPPPKVDTTKKVMEIVELLNKNKDSLAMPNSNLVTIYQNNPELEGYVDIFTNKGKDPSKLGEAVQNWMNSTPEVKQYYDYINDSKVFDFVTEKDSNGNYLTDHNGNFIQRDLTPADFRNIGIPVLDNWQNQSNTMLLPGLNGTLNSVKLNNLAPNFKDSSIYQEYREMGLSDKEALQQIYKKTLTALETDKVIDFARSFGYNEFDVKTVKDERYWFDLEWRKKQEEARDINNIWPGLHPVYKSEDYDSRKTQELIKQKMAELNTMPDISPEEKLARRRKQGEIDNLIASNNLIINSYLDDGEGEMAFNETLTKLGSYLNDEALRVLVKNKDKVKDYISGKSGELGFDFITRVTKGFQKGKVVGEAFSGVVPSPLLGQIGGTIGATLSSNLRDNVSGRTQFNINPIDILNQARDQFSKGLTKRVQKDGLNISNKTLTFLDEQGNPSKFTKALNELVLRNTSAWTFPGTSGKNNEPVTIAQYFADNNVDPTKYDVISGIIDPKGSIPGSVSMRLIPRAGSAGADKLKAFEDIVISPNPNIKPDVLSSLSKIILDNSANELGKNVAIDFAVQSLYGDFLNPIKYDINFNANQNLSIDKTFPKSLYGVPLNKTSNNTSNVKIMYNNGLLELFQLDDNDIISSAPIIRAETLYDLGNYMYEYYLSH